MPVVEPRFRVKPGDFELVLSPRGWLGILCSRSCISLHSSTKFNENYTSHQKILFLVASTGADSLQTDFDTSNEPFQMYNYTICEMYEHILPPCPNENTYR